MEPESQSQFDQRSVAREIFNLITKKRCLAWLGSGLSRPAGYVDWKTLTERLATSCLGSLDLVNGDLLAKRFPDAADTCYDAAPQKYRSTLREEFGGRVVTRRLAYEYLLELPFSGYVTTNFDPLLQYEARRRPGDFELVVYPLLRRPRTPSRPVYYIHGLATHGKPDSKDWLVLRKADFERAYNELRVVPSWSQSELLDQHVLFISSGLAEEELLETLRHTKSVLAAIRSAEPGASIPELHALSASRPTDSERSRDIQRERWHQLGIDNVMFYDQVDDRYSGLESLLEEVLDIQETPVPVQLNPRILSADLRKEAE